MKSSVKTILFLILWVWAKPPTTINHVRLTTVKSGLHPHTRKLMLPGLGGGSKKKSDGKTTVMLLGVMERQQVIKKISNLVANLKENFGNLRSMVDSQVSELSQIANASLNTDKFVIDSH